jgi:hypothetical protein
MSALRGNAVFKEAQFLRPRAELAQVRGLSKLWGWSSRRPGALLHMQKVQLENKRNTHFAERHRKQPTADGSLVGWSNRWSGELGPGDSRRDRWTFRTTGN